MKEFNRRWSCGDLREAVSISGTEPDDIDDDFLSMIVRSLYDMHGVVLVTVYDEIKRHLGVTFRSENWADVGVLEFMAEHGFWAAQAGVGMYSYGEEFYQHAKVEFQPQEGELQDLILNHYAAQLLT